MQTVTFANLWIDGRWQSNVSVRIDAGGAIVNLQPNHAPADAAVVRGLTLPGLADAHCHAFQRLLPAWTQQARSSSEDFWSWREAMYAAAAQLGAAELEAVAARCYLELLRGGYTEVAEFLYLHRLSGQPQGVLDADAAISRAATRAGIGLTLLPALYQYGDFGRVAPSSGQARFVRSAEQFLDDFAELQRRYPAAGGTSLGVAFHSLRAVELHTIEELSAELRRSPRCAALHIHVAEQPAEVEACRRHYGSTPVALLAERGLLDARWALIHAIHTDARELAQIAGSGASLVLCPTTEADLGDGCADAARFLEAGGHLAIGSDSNIVRHAFGELRQLEWALRLLRGRRNVLAAPSSPAVADRLYQEVLAGGWRALGRQRGGTLGTGARADFVTFDAAEGDWPQLPPEYYMSALVFGAEAAVARQVLVGGRWVIRDGRHAHEAEIDAAYRATLQRLRPALSAALARNKNG